jgi:hypothetical protein
VSGGSVVIIMDVVVISMGHVVKMRVYVVKSGIHVVIVKIRNDSFSSLR